jgi:hypothetical protein
MSYPQTYPVSPQVGVVHLGGQQQFVVTAPVTQTTSGAITPVAPAGYQIAILALALTATAAVTLTLESTTGPVLLTGAFTIPINGQLVLPYSEAGWAYSIPADSITLLQSGAATVAGVVAYCLFQRAIP